MRDDIRDWLTLIFLPGLGAALMHRLLTVFGTPKEILGVGRAISKVEGVGRQITAVLTNQAGLAQARAKAEQEYNRIQDADIYILCYDDPLYPERLRSIHTPPVLLYCQGDLSCLQLPSVALVGSRSATDYGQRVSSMLARQLAENGLAVVSGLAKGIDGYAHIGALKVSGKTVAVLGCGLDVVYPGCHSRLYKEISATGLLLSEYPLGTRPEGFRFPARNRIISGLSLGVVVVEAAFRSGSLITARLALEENREVFAVPGRIDSRKSEGAHELLRQGAHLVRTAEDILTELSTAIRMHEPIGQKTDTVCNNLPEPEKILFSSIDTYPVDIEELTEKTGLPSQTLHELLLGLELKGLIRQLPGQQYERV